MTRVLVLAILTPALALGATPERKSLDECIALALQLQPTLAAASATVQAARERVWQSKAAYLPQITATYAANRRMSSTGSLIGGGDVPGGSSKSTFDFYTTGAAFTQVLFDFGQNLALIHRAQALERSAAADADTTRDATVYDVSQAYYALLAAQRLRDVAEETVRQNKQHLDLAQGRYDVGFAPRFDVTQAGVQVATAELAAVTARNNVTLGRETLRNVIGMSGPLDFELIDVLDVPPVRITEADAVALAWDNRPEIRSIVAAQEAAEHQISALQKDYLPRVGGAGTYTFSGRSYPLDNTWNIGAAVNLSVFNGGLTTAQIGEARANLSTLQANAESLRQNVALEVRQSLTNVQQGVESIRVADKLTRQARENVELAEGRYSTGVGSIIELTDAQTSLASAEANRVQALVNYRIAVAALERATAHPVSGGAAS